MILGNCISCNGLMRVPVTTDVTHVARCPHCGVRFPVQQLIASAIPAAEIIDGEIAQEIMPMVDRIKAKSEENADKPRTKFEVAKQLHDGAKHRRRRRRRSHSGQQSESSSDENRDRSRSSVASDRSGDPRSSRSGGRIDASSVPLASTQSLAAAESAGVKIVDGDRLPDGDRGARKSSPWSSSRSTNRTSSRSQNNSRRHSPAQLSEDVAENSLLEIVKIVFGGMIAFPLAYLAMMWMGGLDPFSLAVPMQNVAPFFVPPSLMTDPDENVSPEIDGQFQEDETFDDGQLPMPSIDPDEIRG